MVSRLCSSMSSSSIRTTDAGASVEAGELLRRSRRSRGPARRGRSHPAGAAAPGRAGPGAQEVQVTGEAERERRGEQPDHAAHGHRQPIANSSVPPIEDRQRAAAPAIIWARAADISERSTGYMCASWARTGLRAAVTAARRSGPARPVGGGHARGRHVRARRAAGRERRRRHRHPRVGRARASPARSRRRMRSRRRSSLRRTIIGTTTMSQSTARTNDRHHRATALRTSSHTSHSLSTQR